MSGASGVSPVDLSRGKDAGRPLKTALDPPGWSERVPRAGLFVRYTTVGCVPRGIAAPVDPYVQHALASVMVATTHPAADLDDNVAFWVTVSRRLLQRGTLPLVPSTAQAAEDLDNRHIESLFSVPSSSVDPSIELDSRYERPFFVDVRNRYPAESTFLFPQAPFESCGIGPRGDSTQWVDFLFAPPRGPRTALEIDGEQHVRSKAVDERRDAALRKRGVKTVRVASVGGALASAELFAAIRAGELGPTGVEVEELRSAINAVRLAYGVVEAVATGLLSRAECWVISTAGTTLEEGLLRRTLDLLAAVDFVWSTKTMPQSVEISGNESLHWVNPFPIPSSGVGRARTTVRVDWGPSWAPLPDPGSGGVVVRGVPIPSHAGWDPPLVAQRRTLWG